MNSFAHNHEEHEQDRQMDLNGNESGKTSCKDMIPSVYARQNDPYDDNRQTDMREHQYQCGSQKGPRGYRRQILKKRVISYLQLKPIARSQNCSA